MEEFYKLNHPVISCSNIDVVVHDQLENITSTATTSTFHVPDAEDDNMLRFETEALGTEMSDLIKAQIAGHPRYPDVVAAYIECQKVGVPPETAFLLEEISQENHP
ncbi:hypothetical protein FNV43_RR03627 [Rhamnella rubrinervis]|nr:hypothetical protein FNV43_RR03627 [Rhamnella rubrinervis]